MSRSRLRAPDRADPARRSPSARRIGGHGTARAPSWKRLHGIDSCSGLGTSGRAHMRHNVTPRTHEILNELHRLGARIEPYLGLGTPAARSEWRVFQSSWPSVDQIG